MHVNFFRPSASARLKIIPFGYLLLASLVSGTQSAMAKEASDKWDESVYSFVLDSGTFLDQPSPRSLVSFYENYESLGVVAYDLMEKYIYRTTGDDIDNKSWWVRGRRGFQLLLMPFVFGGEDYYNPPTYITTAGWETVHEYGHRTRDALFGIDRGFNPDFMFLGDNPYSFSFHLLGTDLETGGETWKNAKSKFLYKLPKFISQEKVNVISVAAGMNQQVNLARDHAKRGSWNDSLDVSNFYSYYVSSSSYFIYNDWLPEYIIGNRAKKNDDRAGDRYQLIQSWRLLDGRNYNDAKLARNQLLATFLSGTTWSYILGSVDYVTSGQRQAKVLRFWGFRLPDFYNYYNISGPTLMISSDYRIDEDKLVSFMYERVTDGKNSHELTLGYDQRFMLGNDMIESLHVGGEAGYNFKTGKMLAGAKLDLDVNRFIRLGGGYRYYHFDTLQGERDIPTLRGGKQYHELYAQLSLHF